MVKRKKKGYLLIEVVVYIGLVGILLIGVMNLSIFMAKQYKKISMEIESATRWIEIDRAINSIIKSGNGKIDIIRTHIGCNECNNLQCLDKERCCENNKCLKKCDIQKIKVGEGNESLRIAVDKQEGKDVKILVYGKESTVKVERATSAGTIAKEVIDFKAKNNGGLIYITFIFRDGSEKKGVYER